MVKAFLSLRGVQRGYFSSSESRRCLMKGDELLTIYAPGSVMMLGIYLQASSGERFSWLASPSS